jgi:hypothetical protein
MLAKKEARYGVIKEAQTLMANLTFYLFNYYQIAEILLISIKLQNNG